MSQIDKKIWIGNVGDASNGRFLKDNGITHIICCAEEFKHPPGFLYVNGKTDQLHYLTIVDDVADSKTESQFREGAKKLNEWLEAGHKVIVHCFAGISRSVSTVLAYYIMYKGWSYDLAFLHIKSKRKQINPHPNFIPILKLISTQPQQPQQPQQDQQDPHAQGEENA